MVLDELILPLSFFDYDPRLQSAMTKCVGNQVIVRDEEIATRLLSIAPDVTCVTMHGVIRRKGSMTGGWMPTTHAVVDTPIKLKFRVDRARAMSERLSLSLKAVNAEKMQLQKAIERLKQLANEQKKLSEVRSRK